MNKGILSEDWNTKEEENRDLSSFSYRELKAELERRKTSDVKRHIKIIDASLDALNEMGIKIYNDSECNEYLVKSIQMNEDGEISFNVEEDDYDDCY